MAKAVKRVVSLVCVMVMIASMLAITASASGETGKTTIYGGNSKVICVKTGGPSGGWKSQTPVYVQNKGNKNITVYNASSYANAWVGGVTVRPGGCRTFYMSNNRTLYVTIQASGGTSSVNVYAPRATTSIWWVR